MTSLTRVDTPDVASILRAIQETVSILGDYPCDAAEAKQYGHQFLIYEATVWNSLDNVMADVTITKPGAFTGSTHADRFKHEEELTIYNEKEKHSKGAIIMLRHIFPAAAFLDLENTQGVMVGKTPREIIKNLQDAFCKYEEKRLKSSSKKKN